MESRQNKTHNLYPLQLQPPLFFLHNRTSEKESSAPSVLNLSWSFLNPFPSAILSHHLPESLTIVLNDPSLPKLSSGWSVFSCVAPSVTWTQLFLLEISLLLTSAYGQDPALLLLQRATSMSKLASPYHANLVLLACFLMQTTTSALFSLDPIPSH